MNSMMASDVATDVATAMASDIAVKSLQMTATDQMTTSVTETHQTSSQNKENSHPSTLESLANPNKSRFINPKLVEMSSSNNRTNLESLSNPDKLVFFNPILDNVVETSSPNNHTNLESLPNSDKSVSLDPKLDDIVEMSSPNNRANLDSLPNSDKSAFLDPKLDDSGDSESDDDDEADAKPFKIPADQSIMDYLSALPNLGEGVRTKFLSKVGVEAKKKEIATFLGEKEVEGMTHLEIKQKFNQLDNWKFSQITFPSTAPPRFVVEAQKAKDKEKRELEKERKKAEEKRRAEEEEEKRKEETEKEADKENRGGRSNRKCADATKRKIKRDADAEAKSEVKIVSDVRQAVKELSDFEASSESSSADEWTEKGPRGRKKAKGKKKSKSKSNKTNKKKTIIFRHDPSHNPFIPPAVKLNKAADFDGFDDEEIQRAETLAKQSRSPFELKMNSRGASALEVLPEVRYATKREILIRQERKFAEALMSGVKSMDEFCEREDHDRLEEIISSMAQDTVGVLSLDCPKLDELCIDIDDRVAIDGGAIRDRMFTDGWEEDGGDETDDEEDDGDEKNVSERAVAREQRNYSRKIASNEPRPVRKAASTVKNYVAPEESDVEEDQLLIPCTWCPEQHKFGICPKHPDKLPNYVPNKKVDDESLSVLSRAQASLPESLSIKESRIAGADMGVWYKYITGGTMRKLANKTPLPRGTIFGPYEGRLLSSEEEADRSGTAWEVRLSNGKLVFIDGEDDDEANWLKYVNCSRTAKEQNLYAFDFQGAIYYLVIREVLPGTELLVYYGDAYANTLHIYDEPSPDKTDRSYCDKCDSYFLDESSLAKHLLGHENDWPCELCRFVGKSKEALAQHVRRSHASQYKFHCDLCDFKSNDRAKKESHRRGVHDKERPFVCPTCDKGFTQRAHLFKHETSHSGERPFKCDQCGTGFKRNDDLSRHRREVHEKQIGKFKCEICGKRFNKPCELSNHVRVHTGEKPFKCSLCPASFTVNGNRLRHESKVHKAN